MTQFAITEERLLTTIAEDFAALVSTPTPVASLVRFIISTIKDAIDLVFANVVKVAPICFGPLHDGKAAMNAAFERMNNRTLIK